MTEVQTNTIQTKDARTLAYCEFGDLSGYPIFYAHGGPGSRIEALSLDSTAKKFGFRIIAMDRPGMGGSTIKENRALLDYPEDIRELADTLGIDTFGAMGTSSGGAHTTVCSYSLADRLTFNFAFAGYTNFAEMPGAAERLEAPADRLSIKLAEKSPLLFRLLFKGMGIAMKMFPKLTINSLLKTVSATDKKIAQDPHFQERFIAEQKEAFRQGGKGVAIDAAVHYVDWGVKLKNISGRIHIFHGTEDRLVPFSYGEHLADHIPNAVFHPLEGQGHLFLFEKDYQEMIFKMAEMEMKNSR
ncbi:alpha/beta fold hydrolase [Halobacillus halophilus]|uniref:alpha/beta fold hydrolase n=1 Tax=Halobacillus halophilus TaxID=1570 RepID=UPI001CD5ACCA|nr:alpha/beta hydrolase [Halobacillus halophilus]MCA1010544.1 alpha/beta hydrolase [Halobacillus halophilus]